MKGLSDLIMTASAIFRDSLSLVEWAMEICLINSFAGGGIELWSIA